MEKKSESSKTGKVDKFVVESDRPGEVKRAINSERIRLMRQQLEDDKIAKTKIRQLKKQIAEESDKPDPEELNPDYATLTDRGIAASIDLAERHLKSLQEELEANMPEKGKFDLVDLLSMLVEHLPGGWILGRPATKDVGERIQWIKEKKAEIKQAKENLARLKEEQRRRKRKLNKDYKQHENTN